MRRPLAFLTTFSTAPIPDTIARSGAAAIVLLLHLLGVASPSSAITVVLNNGLAPPNPDNSLDHPYLTDSHDRLVVRNVGCGAVGAFDPCPTPGAPTELAVSDGGLTSNLDVLDTSSIAMTGGTVSQIFNATGASSVILSGGVVGARVNTGGSAVVQILGGEVTYDLFVKDDSFVTLTGGVIGHSIQVSQSGIIEIIGTDFVVSGTPVFEAFLTRETELVPSYAGNLSATLASGDLLDVFFTVPYDGGIQLVQVPEPGTAALVGVGLLAFAAARSRSRRTGAARGRRRCVSMETDTDSRSTSSATG